MLKTYDFHSFIQRPHFSQTAKNLFRASFLTPSDIAAYMFWYFSFSLLASQFTKTSNCSFRNKATQDFAEFWEICGNFKAKTKMEDEGIFKKNKWSSSWFLLLHIT